MRKLHYYKVSIYKGDFHYNYKKNEFISEMVEVAAENDNYIIINDWYFTKLKKEKCSWDIVLGKAQINVRTRDTLLDNGIFYTLYSEKPVTAKSIKKEIEKKVAKEFGWLSNVDLSIIK